MPLHAGSIVPEVAINLLARYYLGDTETVTFVMPGQRPPRGRPHLWLRDDKGGGTWQIHHSPSRRECELLGREPERIRLTTGCGVDERDEAVLAFRVFTDQLKNAVLGHALPTQIGMTTVLRGYLHFIDAGGDGLSRSSIRNYRRSLRKLIEFFGVYRLGGVDYALVKAYEAWRLAQDAMGKNGPLQPPRKVSLKTVAGELEVLRAAFNFQSSQSRINLLVRVAIPKVPIPATVWLTRSDMARLLWACRGRVWNGEAGRMTIMRDIDPSLVGLEGDRPFLRDPEEVARRRRIARLFLLGVYTGGRHGTLLQASHKAGGASVDWVSLELLRMAPGELETTKRRPAALLLPKLVRFLLNWARNDQARGIDRIVHRADGKGYARHIDSVEWADIERDAGIGKHVTVHVFRHTCAMWLKGENVTLWAAANFIGCTTKTLERRYGKWDRHSQVGVLDALTGMRAHKRADRMLREAGLA
ncbi:tyrosine-type recombinase/integrase [Lichenibacterium dinghuense]|uniref:tyrosine-type recombinase/integrase n=1 Tax=Lichenibacterium dinghuense TaxID=2895977 RepID=UPI001F3428F4|nr:hypothetical protein [Lichenibacterium sp. 6Y81]